MKKIKKFELYDIVHTVGRGEYWNYLDASRLNMDALVVGYEPESDKELKPDEKQEPRYRLRFSERRREFCCEWIPHKLLKFVRHSSPKEIEEIKTATKSFEKSEDLLFWITLRKNWNAINDTNPDALRQMENLIKDLKKK